ncbi:MAG: metallophosphoesterase, partial [Myxococcota bacterium]|nr:metallophosphoesterase [Myxococcota bacterium]
PLDPERRAILLGVVDGVLLGVTALVSTRGHLNTYRSPVIERVDIPVEGLPAGLNGLRIAQVSDIHLGPTIRRNRMQEIVEAVNQLEPDLVAVTGDLVDDSVRALRDHVEPIADFSAPLGTYFCTGNHEYYVGAESWCRHLQELGLEVLVNEHRIVSHGGETLVVAGVSDLRAGRYLPAHRSDPGQAFEGAPDIGFRLLLAHQPRSIDAACMAGTDLQVSGHTHGGQFWPFTWLVHLVQPFVAGLHRVGSTWLYVNRGATWWGPPMRLGAPQEITLLTLRDSNSWESG